IKNISEIIKKENKKRKSNKIIFHIDAAQAPNYLDCNVNKLGVDLMTLDSHKIYGPKGVGALYICSGVHLEPILGYGSQEFGLRQGTENVPGIVGFGQAIERIKINKKENKRILKLRDKLIDGIIKLIPNSKLNGPLKNRLPNNVNFSFAGAEGESILTLLSQKGIYISTGSACASQSLKPSHILLAIGLTSEQAHCSIRLSLGKQTSDKDIDYVLEVLPKVIDKLRKISGRLNK
ncbi:cysteine desulfurase family protein, partial [Patescibacteria group bacterium]